MNTNIRIGAVGINAFIAEPIRMSKLTYLIHKIMHAESTTKLIEDENEQYLFEGFYTIDVINVGLANKLSKGKYDLKAKKAHKIPDTLAIVKGSQVEILNATEFVSNAFESKEIMVLFADEINCDNIKDTLIKFFGNEVDNGDNLKIEMPDSVPKVGFFCLVLDVNENGDRKSVSGHRFDVMLRYYPHLPTSWVVISNDNFRWICPGEESKDVD